MNVEGGLGGGPSIGGGVVGAGSAVSVGPSVGISAPGMEGGPAVGFRPSFVNEGPVASKFLENTMPLTLNKFNPIGEIIFNPEPKPSVLAQAEQVAAAAWKVSEPVSVIKQAEEVTAKAGELPLASQGLAWEAEATRVVSEVSWIPPAPNPARGLDIRVITNPFGVAKAEAAPQIIVQKRATSISTQTQIPTEQVVEEKKILTGRQQEDQPEAKRSEKQSVAKIKIVEAVKVTQLRQLAVFEAVKNVKEEAEKTGEKVVITGKKLKKFLSVEFWKYISPLVGKEGHDGTIPLTLSAIENNQTEYTNLEEAQTRLSQPVAEHIPLEKGEGGRVATVDEVREVLEGKEKENLRSQAPAEIVIKRAVVRENETVASAGQAVNTVVEEKEEIIGEPTLKSLGLEEIFPKAA